MTVGIWIRRAGRRYVHARRNGLPHLCSLAYVVRHDAWLRAGARRDESSGPKSGEA